MHVLYIAFLFGGSILNGTEFGAKRSSRERLKELNLKSDLSDGLYMLFPCKEGSGSYESI